MKTIYSKDPANRKIKVERDFSAPLEKIWKAWTEPELLDQWWAPRPWKAETKRMDFREGGTWLYCMVGPEGEKHWARVLYNKIITPAFFSGNDAFSDENGNVIPEPPGMNWEVTFKATGTGTKVLVDITFASEKDLQTIVEMGFEEGFAAAHNNLDELLANVAV